MGIFYAPAPEKTVIKNCHHDTIQIRMLSFQPKTIEILTGTPFLHPLAQLMLISKSE